MSVYCTYVSSRSFENKLHTSQVENWTVFLNYYRHKVKFIATTFFIKIAGFFFVCQTKAFDKILEKFQTIPMCYVKNIVKLKKKKQQQNTPNICYWW